MPPRDQAPKRRKTILSFFKPRETDDSRSNAPSASNVNTSLSEEQCSYNTQRDEPEEVVVEQIEREEVNVQQIRLEQVDAPSFQRDPGLRAQIWEYPVHQRDEVRRAYIKMGPFQPKLRKYPRSESGKQFRRFQSAWFAQFDWLEYSLAKDAVFCLRCFLFESNPPQHSSFTVEGFRRWRSVNNGKKCSFITHMGVGPCSPHMSAVSACTDLMNPSQHIDKVINRQSKNVVEKNRLRLMTTIKCVRYLAYQVCAFRGHDESINSIIRSNFIELVKLLASVNEEIAEVVLENAPGNAKYTSPRIQKEVLHILANKVRNKIRGEVGSSKFCILVDEAQDESHKEQMAIVLRFVDKDGYVRERFFYITHVEDTTALTLKKEISHILVSHNLQIENMRGQGYDGASNMRGAWNGLQALFLKECKYAYYVHCFAHRLQLALVVASKEVGEIWRFFSMLNAIFNHVNASPKRHCELQSAQADEIAKKVDNGELETDRGSNQIGNLQRAGTTRWSSHYASVKSMIDMFDASSTVIGRVMKNGSNLALRGEAGGLYVALRSFELIFILHLMSSIMAITDMLCQALQQKSQDIVNAMNLVSTTKALLQELRQDGWDTFIKSVELFCKEHDISIPDLSARYMVGTERSCQQHYCITMEHHYRIDLYNAAIDFQLMELNIRFTEGTMELLILSSALDPRDAYKSFKIDDICTLAEKFYPQDFTKQDMHNLRCQLNHYKLDVLNHPNFQNLSTISELCRQLVETRKSEVYGLIDRLIRLVLTLPVSTATTERAFSAMNLVKTALRNKMEEEFLGDCMIVHSEREVAETINLDSVIVDFNALKHRRVQLEQNTLL